MPVGSITAMSPKVAASTRFVSFHCFSISPGAMKLSVLPLLAALGPHPPLPSCTRASQRCQPTSRVFLPVGVAVQDVSRISSSPSILSSLLSS